MVNLSLIKTIYMFKLIFFTKKLDLTRFDFDVYDTSGPKYAIAIRRAAANKKVPMIVVIHEKWVSQ